MFAIVKFNDGHEVVPTTWLFEDNSFSKWPPHVESDRIIKDITSRQEPTEDWPSYPVLKIITTTDTYVEAVAKLDYIDCVSDVNDDEKLKKSRHERAKIAFSSQDSSTEKEIHTRSKVERSARLTYTKPPASLLSPATCSKITISSSTQNKRSFLDSPVNEKDNCKQNNKNESAERIKGHSFSETILDPSQNEGNKENYEPVKRTKVNRFSETKLDLSNNDKILAQVDVSTIANCNKENYDSAELIKGKSLSDTENCILESESAPTLNNLKSFRKIDMSNVCSSEKPKVIATKILTPANKKCEKSLLTGNPCFMKDICKI